MKIAKNEVKELKIGFFLMPVFNLDVFIFLNPVIGMLRMNGIEIYFHRAI